MVFEALAAMPIRIPPMVEPDLSYLRCCGEIKTEDASIVALIEDKEGKFSCHEHQADKVYVRWWLGFPTGRHFHVDVFSARYFDQGEKLTTNSTEEEFQRTADRFIGVPIKARIEATFELSKHAVPLLIAQLNSISVDREKINIKLTGGRLKVTGSLVEEINWKSPEEDEEKFSLTLELYDGQKPLSESYLTDCFQLAQKALDQLKKMK